MEKILNGEKSGSFPRFGRRRTKFELETSSFKLENVKPKEPDDNHVTGSDEIMLEHGLNHDQILEQVDRFIESLVSARDKSISPEIPVIIEPFMKTMDSRITTYERREASAKFGHNQDEDSSFFEAVTQLSKMVHCLDEFTMDSVASGCSNRAGSVLQRAMSMLETEFQALLDIWKRSCHVTIMDSKTPKTPKQSVFNSNQPEIETEFPYFPPGSKVVMKEVATVMIFAGHDSKCCVAYMALRLNALHAEFSKQGYENISMEDFQRMEWATQEGGIDNWVRIVKYCMTNLFSFERKLCESIFEHAPIAQRLFCDLATSLTIKLLNFPNALLLIKQYSTEKLFKFLDIYETLCDLISVIGNDLSAKDLIPETQCRIGEAAVSIFRELEDSIKNDNGKIPVANGAVHPLTRYTMNYLKYACEYKDTLEKIYRQHNETEGPTKQEPKNATEDNGESTNTTHFAKELMLVMDLLDTNINMKSKLYRDPSLRYIFLMNNGRYMLQKIKSSNDIYEVMGDEWLRKQSSDLRQYHKNYQRETWGKVLQCMSHEGLQVNGKVSKSTLKERFKSFNAMFDEIHKTQTAWTVSDEQLKSELRVSISAVVIPAYRAFLGRFSSHFNKGKQQEKYMKYQPEDIEGLIDELFEGTVASIGRRRHAFNVVKN
ncbi:CCHC-type integrase-like protein [Hibiscus syriacus]|uniref:Exocyst subunit Exo70 family protein n=1 Tax=Hibiscus syriacus TaxID=106335 RepID=A0A6A2ZGS2_HIBSY|nr:exocyst complex component EXO70B1-like [Hibiscus syriacus]KAE8690790.1 CCHC-type integrase-like protein [Hibiscus syriacus]